MRAGPPPTDLVLAGIRPRWSFPAVSDRATEFQGELPLRFAFSRSLYSLLAAVHLRRSEERRVGKECLL